MILIHRGVPADPTFRINLLSPRVPEGSCAANIDCCEIHEKIRVFLETFLIANLPDEILTNYTMIQGIWQHLREEGFGKSESGEPLQAIPIPCFQERGRPTSLDRGNCPMSVTNNHAAGIGTCTQSGMTIPSCLSSEMPLGKFPDHAEFQISIVNFRTEVCSKAKNLTLALQWIKEIEAAKSLDDLITPKSITGKDFLDYEKLDLMMAAALKRCYDKHTHFREKISVEEQRAQKNDRFLRGRQIAYLIHDCFHPIMKFKEYQDCSVLNWRTTTFRTLIYCGSKHCY